MHTLSYAECCPGDISEISMELFSNLACLWPGCATRNSLHMCHGFMVCFGSQYSASKHHVVYWEFKC